MSNNRPTFAIVGAGSRGMTCYAKYIEDSQAADIVAVAEPRAFFRNKTAEQFSIPPENIFESWEQLLDKPKLADAIIIATTDRMHTAPAVRAAQKGYHILLEKPMAPTAEECIQITEAALENNIIFIVCHVLRYAPFYTKIKDVIDSGTLGEICSIQHFEGVAWWHFPHSFVRGNFGNESRSSFLLLAKCCHDFDILNWWIPTRCRSVSSFGYLKHFREENQPDGAADRCMDCPLADNQCPYSAKKFYFERLENHAFGWPLAMVIDEPDPAALEKALREGPYGKCAYRTDNDVVDTQIVNMDFEDDITVSFTVSAFTPHGRKVRIMGTRGYLEGDEQVIRILDFQSGEWTEFDVNKLATDLTGGHGGGDQKMIAALIEALTTDDKSAIITGAQESLESHLMVFAAETARRENRIVQMNEFLKNCSKH